MKITIFLATVGAVAGVLTEMFLPPWVVPYLVVFLAGSLAGSYVFGVVVVPRAFGRVVDEMWEEGYIVPGPNADDIPARP